MIKDKQEKASKEKDVYGPGVFKVTDMIRATLAVG